MSDAPKRKYKKEWYQKNKERILLARKKYHEANREKHLKQMKEYHAKNKEYFKAYNAAYYLKNKKEFNHKAHIWRLANLDKEKSANKAWRAANKERKAANGLAWARANKAKVNTYAVKHKSAKLRSIPAWANHEAILCYYEFAHLKTKMTGDKWEVDHIVPLQSKLVCGLHTDWNLRVIRKAENVAKYNRYWPDMP